MNNDPFSVLVSLIQSNDVQIRDNFFYCTVPLSTPCRKCSLSIVTNCAEWRGSPSTFVHIHTNYPEFFL